MTQALGIDVSVYQRTTPSLTGLSFLIARASIGTVPDRMFATHIANARAAGLVVGAYHFGLNSQPLADQAAVFMHTAGDVDLLFLDVEGAHAPSQAQTAVFFNYVHKAGKKVGLYHSASGYFDVGQDYDWIAKWTAGAPSRHWDFWQYRGSPGDLDRYNGTPAQLRARFGVPPAPPSDIEVPPVNQGNVPPVPTLVTVKTGQYLHVDSSMTPNAGNVAAPAGLEVPLLINDDAGAYRIVEYQKKSWWLYWDAVASMRAAPVPAPDCKAEVAAAVTPVTKALADANALVANYHDRLVKVNGLSAV